MEKIDWDVREALAWLSERTPLKKLDTGMTTSWLMNKVNCALTNGTPTYFVEKDIPTLQAAWDRMADSMEVRSLMPANTLEEQRASLRLVREVFRCQWLASVLGVNDDYITNRGRKGSKSYFSTEEVVRINAAIQGTVMRMRSTRLTAPPPSKPPPELKGGFNSPQVRVWRPVFQMAVSLRFRSQAILLERSCDVVEYSSSLCWGLAYYRVFIGACARQLSLTHGFCRRFHLAIQWHGVLSSKERDARPTLDYPSTFHTSNEYVHGLAPHHPPTLATGIWKEASPPDPSP